MLPGLLQQVFTCNIDGLDHQIDIPDEKIVAVHGTLSRARCEFCAQEMPFDEFCALVRSNIKDISASDASAPAESNAIRCPNPKCGRAGMKPATVLYGADLDAQVMKQIDKQGPANMLFVVGTSLSVKPSLTIPSRSKADVRVFVNRDAPPPGFKRDTDQFLQGDCDEMFAALAARLGWLPEMAARFGGDGVLPEASLQTLNKALEAAKLK
jgi:NAD-dependent SIR2 family protein deacetylase